MTDSPVSPRRAVAVAGHLGDVVAARAGLAHVDAGVRATALTALDRLDALDDEALAAASTDLDPSVRRRAAQLAAGYPEVPLDELLADDDAMVAEMAAWACGERVDVDESTFARLCALAADHDDALVREAAVAALGAIGDESALDIVLAATRDKPAVRRRAVIALAAFEGDAVDDALRAALSDRDWQVRQAAEELLSITAESDDPTVAGDGDLSVDGARDEDQPSS